MGTVVTGSTSPVSGTLAFTPTEETWKFEYFVPYGGGSGKLDLTGVNEMDSGFFAGNHYPKGSQPANPVTKAFKGFPGNSTTNTPDTEDPTVQAKKFLLDIYTQHYSKPPATLPDIILAPGSTADKYYVKVGDYTYKPEETMTLGGQVDEAYAAVMTLVTRVTGSASSGAVPPPPTSSPPPTAKNPLVNEPKNTVVKIASSNPQYYMRLGYLLEYMKNKIVPVHQNSKEPILNIAYEKDASMMYCFPISISVNPTICIVKNKTFTKLNNKQAQVFNELEDWKSTDNKAHPANIYLNFDFIISCLTSTTDERGDTNIYGFIQELCVGINKALGGVNNLEAVVEESSNTIRLVDTTPIPKEISSDISPIIELFGYDASQKNSNFVRNIQLKTAITPEFASTATVGATAKGYVKGSEGVAFSKLNEGLTDRFNPELVPPSPNTQPNEAQTNYENDFLKWVSLCYGMDGDLSSVPPVVGKISDSVIKKNVSIVTEYYKYLLATQTNNQSGTIGFIPFKLSYTTDGISGINIYDKLTIDTRFFPYEYGAALDFIVTGVSHTLKGNDWETGIETTVIGKSKAVTVPTRAGVEVTNAATQEPYIPSPTSPSPVTPSGPLKAGDLYTWVKGGNSTVPDFPDGYAADVLKYNVPNNLIPYPGMGIN